MKDEIGGACGMHGKDEKIDSTKQSSWLSRHSFTSSKNLPVPPSPPFYGTRSFITEFKVPYPEPNEPSLRCVLMLSSRLFPGISSSVFHSSFPTKAGVHFS